jgi:hypothetical protein
VSRRLLGSVVLAVGAGLVGFGVGLIIVDLWPDGAITGRVLRGDLLFLVLPGLVAMWTGRRLRRRSSHLPLDAGGARA